jgi:CheY-like chemotaxis protein
MKKKILFIEDNQDVRETTTDILELANYNVITAENGIIGVKKAKKYLPDIILCDIMMPELNGYGVLQILSKNFKTASIPFIFLTAKTEKIDIRKGMNLGADDYLTKPFEENELLDALACRLNKSDFIKKEFAKNIEGLNEFLNDATVYVNLEMLSKDRELIKCSKDVDIFTEGRTAHSLYFIESGTLKTHKNTKSGKEFITGIYGSGNFVGQLSLLSNKGIYVETATAMEDTELYSIPKSDFIKLLFSNKVVSNKFINMISNDLIELQEQLVNMAYASVRQRAAVALIELYNKGLIKDEVKKGIGIPREDFAGIIGTATETAIRALSEFKEEGLISVESGRRIIILKKDKLEQIANLV